MTAANRRTLTSDMRFGNKFTQLNFKAKSFTHQSALFSQRKCINIRNIGPFLVKLKPIQPFLSSKLSLFLNCLPCRSAADRDGHHVLHHNTTEDLVLHRQLDSPHGEQPIHNQTAKPAFLGLFGAKKT